MWAAGINTSPPPIILLPCVPIDTTYHSPRCSMEHALASSLTPTSYDLPLYRRCVALANNGRWCCHGFDRGNRSLSGIYLVEDCGQDDGSSLSTPSPGSR